MRCWYVVQHLILCVVAKTAKVVVLPAAAAAADWGLDGFCYVLFIFRYRLKKLGFLGSLHTEVVVNGPNWIRWRLQGGSGGAV